MKPRKGESGAAPLRNGRFHCINNQWFFSVRGPELRGPFKDQDEAEKALLREIGRPDRAQHKKM